MASGSLEVTSISAHILPHARFHTELKDIYAALRCIKDQKFTKSVRDQGRQPQWNDTFSFNIQELDFSKDFVVELLAVRTPVDELLGTSKIPIESMLGKAASTSCTLISPSQGEIGEITVAWKWKPGTQVESWNQDLYSKLDSVSDALTQMSVKQGSSETEIAYGVPRSGDARVETGQYPAYYSVSKGHDEPSPGYPPAHYPPSGDGPPSAYPPAHYPPPGDGPPTAYPPVQYLPSGGEGSGKGYAEPITGGSSGYPPTQYPPSGGEATGRGYGEPITGDSSGYPPAQYPPSDSDTKDRGFHSYQYPPAPAGYPPAGYPAPYGHPSGSTHNYPPQPHGYPSPSHGYPPQGYPPAAYGHGHEAYQYPPAPHGYPPAPHGYPPSQHGYPQAPHGYPPAPYGYPSAAAYAPHGLSHGDHHGKHKKASYKIGHGGGYMGHYSSKHSKKHKMPKHSWGHHKKFKMGKSMKGFKLKKMMKFKKFKF